MYVFWILHQTTTLALGEYTEIGCISFDSYIKPQPTMKPSGRNKVVYLLIPTSNHNPTMSVMCSIRVVYLLIPTSNHNRLHVLPMSGLLYIFWFLHQTTTQGIWRWYINSCISFDSYIKPQPKPHKKGSTLSCISFDSYIKPQLEQPVLECDGSCISFDSYIKPQRLMSSFRFLLSCISFDSYIKPQLSNNQ